MRNHNKALWSLLHFLAIISVSICLVTGLRIAVLEHDYLLLVSNILPQGELHTLHIFAACGFTVSVFTYITLMARGQMYSLAKATTRNLSIRYHLLISRLLYPVSMLSLLSGWLLFWEGFSVDKSLVLFVHYLSALSFIVYILLHGGVWFVEYGSMAFVRMIRPLQQRRGKASLLVFIIVLVPISWLLMTSVSSHTLRVNLIDVNQHIEINGEADELQWQLAKPLTLYTHGGANFGDGATPITLRALYNGSEIFMYIEWQDDTESLRHLPLVKTEAGWRIQQNGFHEFNETLFYEDKLAIILAENCDFAAAGTAHLGPQPLSDKPRHWKGQGYHYSETGIVDLWHWKAVRTNQMHMIDDNYIGEPDIVREGYRRYTAGYKADARESGSYRMNWKWYSRDVVEPKRLPVKAEWLAPYQANGDIKQAEMPWVLPWFDGEPYSPEKDKYAIGTVLPSILYTSNQFEGDRAHVRAFGKWHEGKWSLELFRKLDTGSSNDVAIRDGICLWVAAFDHSQIAHTRHVRPIELRMQQ